ncbi:MAG: EAL domain-containing protein, partial [Chloroflexota bacterium]
RDLNHPYRQADVPPYWAKRHGLGFVEVFDADRDQLPGESGPEGASNAVYEVARGRRFSPVFQPIVDLRTGVVLGFEGLVRPDPQGPFPDAEALFTAAAATDRTVELDLACLEVVAAGASGISGDHIVSINLSAKTLEVKEFDSGWLLNTLVRHGISPSRVIVELTERDPISDVKRLKENVRHLGQYGLRLAADDVGAGNAGLRLLSQVQFDIVKIDLSLVQDSVHSTASWAVLRSLRDLAWRQDALVVGEGVEHPEQLRVLRQMDISIGQGYLLGRPSPRPHVALVDVATLSSHGDVAAPVPSASGGRRRTLHLPGPLLPPLDTGQLQPSPVPTAQV